MIILASLHSEWSKLRHSSAFTLCLLTAFLIPVLAIIQFGISGETLPQLISDPFNLYLARSIRGLTLLTLPLLAVFLCILIPQIEYRNNGWKQILVTPQPKAFVFLSKFMIVHSLLLAFMLVSNVLLVAGAMAVATLQPQVNFHQYPVDWPAWFVNNMISYSSILALTSFVFWIGIRSRNFLVPIGISVVMWIATVAIAENDVNSTVGVHFPFAFPALMSLKKYEDVRELLAWRSLGYEVVFFLLGLMEFVYTKGPLRTR